ncbi:MAG: TetR/AcrR family transcriptional regulator [Candidatus Bathyarchaeia archaeon]
MPKVVPGYKKQARTGIIEQALKMFLERGYHHTRMTDIASSLGVSKGAIYQYFNSKEQLLIEVIKYRGERRTEAVQGFLDSDSPKAISTSEFFDKMLELSLSVSPLSIELLHETTRNKVLRKMLARIAEGWSQQLIKLIDEMKSNGTIRPDVDSPSLSRGILALRDGLYSHLMMGADTNEVRKTWVYIMGYIVKDILT